MKDLKKTIDATKQLLEKIKADPKAVQELSKALEKKQALKAEHQPHPGPSKPEHQKQHDAKIQAESEKHLKSPKGDKERQDRNAKMRAMMKADDDMLEKAKIIAGPGHQQKPGTMLANLPSPDVGKRPHISGANPDMKAIQAQRSAMAGARPAAQKRIMGKDELQACMMKDDAGFAKGYKKVAKDDKPHAPESPEDKAHDVVEEKEPVNQAVKEVSGSKDKFFSHLRDSQEDRKEWSRSPKNQAAGKDVNGVKGK